MEVYLNIDELAAMLKLSKQTIRRYVLNKVIPYRKIKKAVRFRVSEIEKWIDSGCTENVLIVDETESDLFTENADLQNNDGEN